MIRQVLAASLIVAAAVALLVLGWPQLFRLELAPFVAQAVSFRGLAVLAALIVAVMLGLVALVSIGARRLAGSLALLLIAYSGVNLAVLASRGFGGDTRAAFGAVDAASDEVTVLAWNTQGDVPGAEAIARLALEARADVLALAETSADAGDEIAALMDADGRPMARHTSTFDEFLPARSTTLLISEALGPYSIDTRIGNTAVLPTVVVRPDSGVGPSFAAVHPVAPVPRLIGEWRTDLEWLSGVCEGNIIMAGDFNSTLDHLASFAVDADAEFGECTDAALAADTAAVGTWPSTMPALLATPIDHILATRQWRAVDARVLQDYGTLGSDHRPVVARLAPSD